ncbi:hypothetical protein [Streptomonospora salina]|uniref:Uncharacterized protein n=1 Tax=Streptomonospora salina TaxID=104205 RepID=A0A841EAH3_9ACTN|nr:hypothetical protein [Streptomonospora salina]MBB5996461.1 hypothetical protein [Streptomonospora salina]
MTGFGNAFDALPASTAGRAPPGRSIRHAAVGASVSDRALQGTPPSFSMWIRSCPFPPLDRLS